jgi:hypothetical protein
VSVPRTVPCLARAYAHRATHALWTAQLAQSHTVTVTVTATVPTPPRGATRGAPSTPDPMGRG